MKGIIYIVLFLPSLAKVHVRECADCAKEPVEIESDGIVS